MSEVLLIKDGEEVARSSSLSGVFSEAREKGCRISFDVTASLCTCGRRYQDTKGSVWELKTTRSKD